MCTLVAARPRAPAAPERGRSRRPVRRHRRIVRHVLRLERVHLNPAQVKARASPRTINDLPTSEPVPWNISARARHRSILDARLRLHARRAK